MRIYLSIIYKEKNMHRDLLCGDGLQIVCVCGLCVSATWCGTEMYKGVCALQRQTSTYALLDILILNCRHALHRLLSLCVYIQINIYILYVCIVYVYSQEFFTKTVFEMTNTVCIICVCRTSIYTYIHFFYIYEYEFNACGYCL